MNCSHCNTAARILAVLAAVGSPFDTAFAELAYVMHWGGYGTGPTQFNYPTGIALGPSGDVFVIDGGNHRVCRYTPDGEFVSSFGGLGTLSGKLNRPDHSQFSPANGDLYVTDLLNHRVQRFTEGGAFVLKWGTFGSGPGQFDAPWGIHVDAAGNVWVVSREQERLQKFTADGAFVTQWGSTGTGPGQFMKPHGITTDADGNVYVSDVERHDIQKFDASGAYILEWGSPGSGVGQFLHPHFILEVQGTIAVVDWLEHPHCARIQSFTTSGVLIDVLLAESQGTGPFQFDTLYGVALDGMGFWYGVEWGNHRVHKLMEATVAVSEPLPLRPWATVKAGYRLGR